jgi:predicted nucleotidyltransferase
MVKWVLYLNRTQVENTIEEIVVVAQKDDSITGIILYGSYNQNDFFEDIDIALAFQEDTPKQMMFSKRIDFSSKFPDFIDFQVLNLLPLAVQKEVLEGRVLYETRSLYDLAYQIIREFEDFEKYRIQYVKSVLFES